MSIPPSSSKPTRPERSASGPFRAILLYTRSLILDQHLRHATMFYAVLIPMIMAFVGYEFAWDWMDPRQHFYRFAFYWLICGWLTVLAALLAIYDILVTRLQHRLARRVLREKMLAEAAERAKSGE